MANIKESTFHYSGFRGDSNPVVITWEDQPDENGLYPIQQLKGETMTVSHFQAAVVNTYAMRKELNNWLHNQLQIKNHGKKNKN